MIKITGDKKVMIAKLGSGTVRVQSSMLLGLDDSYKGLLHLTTCKKQKIGIVPGLESIKDSNKIVLEFSNTESIDIVIDKLLSLKEDLENLTKV